MTDAAIHPLQIFYCYANEDKKWLDQVETHLTNLRSQNLIADWGRHKSNPGNNKKQENAFYLSAADIILLFISPNFMASEECKNDKLEALKRYEAGKTRVIPILIRPVEWEGSSFHDLQVLPKNGVPVSHWPDSEDAIYDIVKALRTVVIEMSTHSTQKPKLSREKETHLKTLIVNDHNFMQNRLKSFVGRQQELQELYELIITTQKFGGYITITGQAGQGKSSIIAKLIEKHGSEQDAYHFILFNAGLNYQVRLLRDLMARIVYKYQLSDIYISSESRATLRDYFPKALQEVVEKGGKEVIYIDGLDQIQMELTGERDLSFLPNNPPPGIVFVLGTRPDDTLSPLKLLKTREYRLPNLSRADFSLILQHRHTSLKRKLADRFYEAMKKNALYLDLVAKELAEVGALAPEEIISHISNNPDQLFSIAIERLKRDTILWENVVYPTLGLLLAARESLSIKTISQLLGVPDYRCREGFRKLGGLVVEDNQQRYTLLHLKLRDYLLQDEHDSTKDYLFSVDEEKKWHEMLATWCEHGGLQNIWQKEKANPAEKERHIYAWKHYITHLYHTDKREHLFSVLDAGNYGKAKTRFYDPSTRSYTQDLDLGRQAAIWEGWTLEEGIAFLPHLWYYTLLRCSLASRADQYPVAVFRLLVLLKHIEEAIELAELLTDPISKIKALVVITKQIGEDIEKEFEQLKILRRACELIDTIRKSSNPVEITKQTEVLSELSLALAQLQQWEQAAEVISVIQDKEQQAEMLAQLGIILVQSQQWKQATEIMKTIQTDRQRTTALRNLGIALAQNKQWELADEVIETIQRSWLQAEILGEIGIELAQNQQEKRAQLAWERAIELIKTIQDKGQQANALNKLGITLTQAQQWELATTVITAIQDRKLLVEALSQLGIILVQAQQWQQATEIWQQAKTVISTIQDKSQQAEALSQLGIALAQAQQWQQAAEIWQQAKAVINTIQDKWQQAEALSQLGIALAQAQQWQQAIEIITTIQDDQLRAEALSKLGITLAQTQQWELATTVITTIQDKMLLVEALSQLGIALVKSQQWQQAKTVWEQTNSAINTIKDEGQRNKTLLQLGNTLVQLQQWKQARDVWQQSKEMISAIQDDKLRDGMLNDLGTALAQAQQWQQADEVISTIQDDELRDEVLSELGIALSQTQQWERVTEVWKQAIAVINIIKDNELQAEAWSNLGISLMQAQQWQLVTEVWKQAKETIISIHNNELQTRLLRRLETAFMQEHQWEQAIEVINTIRDKDQRAEALSDLGIFLVQARQWRKASEIWEQIKSVVSTFQDDEQRYEVLSQLVVSLVQIQQWKQAIEVINTIQDENQRYNSLNGLVSNFIQVQQWEQARLVIDIMKNDWQQVKALEELNKALLRSQQQENTIKMASFFQQRMKVLSQVGIFLVQERQWEQTKVVIDTFQNEERRFDALSQINLLLEQAQRWEQATEKISIIQDDVQRIKALNDLRKMLVEDKHYEYFLRLIQLLWLQVETRKGAIIILSLIVELIPLRPTIGPDCSKVLIWVDDFLRGLAEIS